MFSLESFLKSWHFNISRSERALLKLRDWSISRVSLRGSVYRQIAHILRLELFPFGAHSSRFPSNWRRIETLFALMDPSCGVACRSTNLLKICQSRLILENFKENVRCGVPQLFWLRIRLILWTQKGFVHLNLRNCLSVILLLLEENRVHGFLVRQTCSWIAQRPRILTWCRRINTYSVQQISRCVKFGVSDRSTPILGSIQNLEKQFGLRSWLAIFLTLLLQGCYNLLDFFALGICWGRSPRNSPNSRETLIFPLVTFISLHYQSSISVVSTRRNGHLLVVDQWWRLLLLRFGSLSRFGHLNRIWDQFGNIWNYSSIFAWLLSSRRLPIVGRHGRNCSFCHTFAIFLMEPSFWTFSPPRSVNYLSRREEMFPQKTRSVALFFSLIRWGFFLASTWRVIVVGCRANLSRNPLSQKDWWLIDSPTRKTLKISG